MLNKVQIIGRLGRDVELRQTPSGQSVASFTVATDESYTSRDGQKVEQTEWHRINIFGKQAELCGRFLGKGSLIYLEGRIRSRKWTDKEGIERTSTEINADRVQFLDRKPEQPQRQAQAQEYGGMQDVPF